MTPELTTWVADLERLLGQILEYFRSQIFHHLNGSRRLYWLYLLTSLLLAGLVYWRSQPKSDLNFKGFLSFCFPKEIYFHPSALLDYQIFIINNILAPGNLRLAWFETSLVASLVNNWLQATFGYFGGFTTENLGSLVIFTLLFVAVFDFASYLNHAWHHQNPILWQFHSLHHSSEVLTPISLYRSHPLYELNKKLITTAISAPLQGILIYLFFGKIHVITLFGLNFLVALYYMAGGNLAHSHIWLDYGKIGNHIFISPVLHQIHHSIAPQHINKNYGEFLGIWDWMFGTLYLPEKEEKLEFGIGKNQPQPYPTLTQAYLDPVVNAINLLIAKIPGKSGIKTINLD
ncbi:hypothetical protein PCC9214_02774 [Planktothrix tepida]|uniref:Fatty acid hydroxylase domain-containing protein n=1 Tax=Planktothrix tepida PCC 9214 TaxID=671072 RepID=A0A1J1LP09_9CYAN|nr:sterol desaturase family protein [Planktothrix tepida]CAD5954552.1 hypothetical protein PCC9214_02774 [Planktothrix tepida]CUR34227.1 conserved membrane hypothetical protein [Planktothrix tepida PCC 9214]